MKLKVPKLFYNDTCDKISDVCSSNSECLSPDNESTKTYCICPEDKWWNSTFCS